HIVVVEEGGHPLPQRRRARGGGGQRQRRGVRVGRRRLVEGGGDRGGEGTGTGGGGRSAPGDDRPADRQRGAGQRPPQPPAHPVDHRGEDGVVEGGGDGQGLALQPLGLRPGRSSSARTAPRSRSSS